MKHHHPVRELMTDEFVTVQPDTPLSKVVRVLAENRVRSMPVVDASSQLVGIISETDLFLKERNVPFSTQPVPTLLGRIIDEREVETASEETTLEEAAIRMMRLGITNLPVVRAGMLIGVVRRIDILRAIFGTEPTTSDQET